MEHGINLGITKDGPSELGTLRCRHTLGDREDDIIGAAEARQNDRLLLRGAGPIGDSGVLLSSQALLGGREGNLSQNVGNDGLLGLELELEKLEAASLGIHQEENNLKGRAARGGGTGGLLGRSWRRGLGGCCVLPWWGGGCGKGLGALIKNDAVFGLIVPGCGLRLGGSSCRGLGRNFGGGLFEGKLGNCRFLLLGAAGYVAKDGLGLLGHRTERGAAAPAAG
mmetsp:Transcript_34944/g.76436  ORF Transcript_34944/g.76436 Transcript_34944/m.76436 type:complete len:224 (+) Transcript_34944:477-1148(+)